MKPRLFHRFVFCEKSFARGRQTGEGICKKCRSPNDFFVIIIDICENMVIMFSCMDTKKDRMTLECGSLGNFSRDHLIVGAKQLKKALRAGRVRQVYLAENADPAVTEPLANACTENCIPVAWIRSMSELGRACGIDVGAATAAVVD